MEMAKKKFKVTNTSCESCAEIIRRQAKKVEGVKEVTFDYAKETGQVSFDSNKTSIREIFDKIEEKGYNIETIDDEEGHQHTKRKSNNIFGWIFALVGIALLAFFALSLENKTPVISQNMGYGLLFVLGLLTGLHCIAMCGGFVVGFTAKNAKEGKDNTLSPLIYGGAKTISYVIIGALFGLLGSFIAFTPQIRGIVGILAGVFLIIFGINMLNLVPWFRNVRLRAPNFISRFIGEKSQNAGPPVIGLLNGLMIACGPLQAIYIMAAGTGSWIEGAKLLLIFGLGTLPAMIAFAYLTSFISNKVTMKILKVSGAVVLILGLIMLNNGLVLTGSGLDFKTMVAKANAQSSDTNVQTVNSYASPNSQLNQNTPTYSSDKVAVLKDGYQEIHMDVTAAGWSPDTFILKKGVPVKWIINAKEITSCNRAIQVPKYNLAFDLKQGLQTIEFTPNESGTVPWSCWMGMIPGTFIVKDDIGNLVTANAVNTEVQTAQAAKPARTGGCGCGMMAGGAGTCGAAKTY